MTALILSLVVIIWVRCDLLAYQIQRRYYKERGWTWTINARNIALAWFPLGPINLFATWAAYGSNKESRW